MTRRGHFADTHGLALECIEELGLAGGKAPSTLGTEDTVKNLAEAEDGVSEVEPKIIQRLGGKMIHHSSDDPTIQFEIVGYVQANNWSNGKGDAGDADRPTLSWKFIPDRPSRSLQCGCRSCI